MKKKYSMATVAFMMAMSSTLPVMASNVTNSAQPTFSVINQTDYYVTHTNESEKLNERHKMLKETIEHMNFDLLSLSEKVTLLDEFYTTKTKIYKEDQRLILSFRDTIKLNEMKERLEKDSDNQNKDLRSISKIVKELKTNEITSLNEEDKVMFQEQVVNLIKSYQDSRSAGRTLDVLLTNKEKMLNTTALRMHSKYNQLKEDTLTSEEVLDKELKDIYLKNGDVKEYREAVTLLKETDKQFFFVNHHLAEVSTPMIMHKERHYIEILDILKIDGFEFKSDSTNFTLKYGENELTINRVDLSATFNKEFIGSNVGLIQDNKFYLPLRSTFEIFSFDVKSDKEIGATVINKRIYEMQEVDKLDAETFVSNLLK